MASRSHQIGPPTYMVESVHNALILLNAVRDQGSLRLKDAAAEIHSAESTAHRLLATLAYHNFVVRDEQRRYRPGPALGMAPTKSVAARKLRDRCHPFMTELGARTGEMVTLVVRTGARVRVIATVESTRSLRIGTRQGHVPPAHGTAGGRALLAELTDEQVRALYATVDEADRLTSTELDELLNSLRATRRSGFAMAVGVVDREASSVGAVLRNRDGDALGALAVALPTLRLRESLDQGLVATLGAIVRHIEPEIADLDVPAHDVFASDPPHGAPDPAS